MVEPQPDVILCKPWVAFRNRDTAAFNTPKTMHCTSQCEALATKLTKRKPPPPPEPSQDKTPMQTIEQSSTWLGERKRVTDRHATDDAHRRNRHTRQTEMETKTHNHHTTRTPHQAIDNATVRTENHTLEHPEIHTYQTHQPTQLSTRQQTENARYCYAPS